MHSVPRIDIRIGSKFYTINPEKFSLKLDSEDWVMGGVRFSKLLYFAIPLCISFYRFKVVEILHLMYLVMFCSRYKRIIDLVFIIWHTLLQSVYVVFDQEKCRVGLAQRPISASARLYTSYAIFSLLFRAHDLRTSKVNLASWIPFFICSSKDHSLRFRSSSSPFTFSLKYSCPGLLTFTACFLSFTGRGSFLSCILYYLLCFVWQYCYLPLWIYPYKNSW